MFMAQPHYHYGARCTVWNCGHRIERRPQGKCRHDWTPKQDAVLLDYASRRPEWRREVAELFGLPPAEPARRHWDLTHTYSPPTQTRPLVAAPIPPPLLPNESLQTQVRKRVADHRATTPDERGTDWTVHEDVELIVSWRRDGDVGLRGAARRTGRSWAAVSWRMKILRNSGLV